MPAHYRSNAFRNKWIFPLFLVSVLMLALSLRMLSDPDLGFHLKYGKWIIENHSIPQRDLSTYTVTQHEYIDLHWLFQVLLYAWFSMTGYSGISFLVCFLSLILFALLLQRNISNGISAGISCVLLFIGVLTIESSLAPHPELITFLFITLMLILLDRYYDRPAKQILYLPLIMVIWCNMHGLFPLGFVMMGAYFISIWFRDKKVDRSFLIIMVLSLLVCLINPYFFKGLVFPLELLTRFDSGNIFHQRIQEFKPFIDQKHMVIRDILFILLISLTIISSLFTFRKRKIHEFLLLLFFGVLSFFAIRNVPLFVLISIPVCGKAIMDTLTSFRKTEWINPILLKSKIFLYIILVIIPAGIILQVISDNYYISNRSTTKTGWGVDEDQLPDKAADFLLHHHLDSTILNSIGFGGWLSWRLPQPVFIDGRLEVMQEKIYEEVTDSWEKGGLAKLVEKYNPRLIVYNYRKYYPWTFQLLEMPEWRLVYLDGLAAVFLFTGYSPDIPAIKPDDFSTLADEKQAPALKRWLEKFYLRVDYTKINRINITFFGIQMNSSNTGKTIKDAVVLFNRGNQHYQDGKIREALSDYDSALILDPSYFKALNNRGIIKAFELHDFPSALMDFTRAIEINPKYGDAYFGRGTVKFNLHDREGACHDWQIASSLGKTQADHLISIHCKK